MVLLTMTPATVRALSSVAATTPEELSRLQQPSEPALADARTGNPISHSQLVNLSKLLKKHSYPVPTAADEDESTQEDEASMPTTLDALLRGSEIYTPPPLQKKEPTPEFVRLMARLRAEEEARAYDRMTNPNPLTKLDSFSQRFPNTSHFSLGAYTPTNEEDELSYEEVHRQIILIINVIVSIVACAVFVWVAARHWSVPKRLGLSMGSGGAVAVAEVVVYNGYARKVAEAKRKEKNKPEIKEIVQSWVLGNSGDKVKEVGVSSEKADDGVRYRKGRHR